MRIFSPVDIPAAARQPRCVAVDLTLLVPRGENGGSWVMTATLIKRLSELLPHWSFVLLTSDVGHAEAALLDSANVRRVCVERHQGHRRVAPFEPLVRRFAQRRVWSHHEDNPDLLAELGASLLLCPFGQFRMPTFLDPRVPVVSVIYDLQFLEYPQFFSAADVASRQAAYHSACGDSDALVCISEATRQAVLRTYPLDPDRVSTVYIRTHHRLDVRAPVSVDILQRLGLQPNKYFVYPANLWLHKNHEVLMVAMSKLLRRHHGWDFKIVCPGAGLGREEELRERAMALGVGEFVLFAGYLPRPEVDALLLHCRGMVYPSVYEGFGIPLLEAMLAGKPIICSNVTSLPEIGGDAVSTFDPSRPGEIADALVRIATNDDIAAQLADAGARRVEEFGDSERMAREYLDVFLAVLNGTRQLQSRLHGVYSDGWTSGRILVVLGEREANGQLELTLSLPAWAPIDAVTVVQSTAYSPDLRETRITAGSSAKVRVHVDARPGWVELRLSPTFCPEANGLNSDRRSLTVVCEGAHVVTDGVPTELAESALV